MRAAMPSEITSAALVRNSDGDLRLVGLQLVERAVERRVLVAGVLQLDHAERQAVDEDHHVRPAVRLVLDHGELVHRQPVVGVGIVEVDQADLLAADGAVGAAHLDRHALDHVAMQPAVLGKAFDTGNGAAGRIGTGPAVPAGNEAPPHNSAASAAGSAPSARSPPAGGMAAGSSSPQAAATSPLVTRPGALAMACRATSRHPPQ